MAAQTLAAIRRYTPVGLVAFAGIACIALAALLLWRRRLLLGSYAWAQEHDGRLRRAEKAALIVPLATALATYGIDRISILRRRGDGPNGPFEPPGGEHAAAIDRYWASLLDAASGTDADRLRAVHRHSQRAYHYGLALARRDHVKLDHEQFYLAAMAHDLGLVTDDTAGRCFTLVGADRLAAILPPGRVRTQLCDGVVNHITPSLGLSFDDPMDVYLQRGSLLDLTGQRARKLPGGYRAAVEDSIGQRQGQLVAELWEQHAAQVSGGRAKFVNCSGLFVRLFR